MDPRSEPEGELHRRLRQQEVVAELGQQALETDDLDRLMHDASVAVAETLDAEYAKVLELLPDGDRVLLRQGVGWRDGLVGSATVPTDLDSQAGYTLISEEPVIVDDLRTEERFSGPDLLTDHGVVSGISVVVGSVDDPWGVLGVHTPERREFTTHDANFVQSVANVLATAIENEQTRRKLEEIYGRITDAFYALDDDWTVTYANDRAEALIDFSGDGLVGKNVWEQFEWAADSKLREEYEEAMETQEATSFEIYYPEPLSTWFEIHAYPSETGLSVYFRDVTGRKERERELELFRTLLDHSNDSVLVVDPETGRYLDVNDTACRRRGYSRSELLELSVPDLQTEIPDRDAWQSFVEDLTEEGRTTFDGEHRRKDGTTYPVEINATYVELDRAYVLAVARDVTERRRRERELEESERRYRTLAECFPNGIVALFDDDLEYTLAAGRAFDNLPVTQADVEGNTVREAWGEEAAEKLEPSLRAALDGEEAEVELAYAGREWIVHAVPIVDENETVYAGMTMAQDITERKEIRRRLEESERRYRTLAENFPNGAVGVYDHDLRYTLTTGAVLGDRLPSADRLEGERMPDLFPADTVADLEPLFRAAVEDGETDSVTTEFGGRIWRVWAAPLRNADDEIFAGLSFTQDVTEEVERKRRLEEVVEQLEESNERLEQFAYAASHDLQEPLRMVSSYLQLIERRYADELDADGEEFLDYAVDGAERMREMIDGLLEYSRVDTQGDPLEPVDLDEVLAKVLDNLQVKIEETDAEITTEPLPRVRGDDSQLQQVLQNLLSNAIEYSGDGPPRVHVSADRRGRRWEISVRDEGIGIDPDDEERVFEVFQRLHSREHHAGTGIGLALCQRIVERHGGDIWIESTPGDGTTVSFTLPAARDAAE